MTFLPRLLPAALLTAAVSAPALAGGGYVAPIAAPAPMPSNPSAGQSQRQSIRVATFNVALDKVRVPMQEDKNAGKGDIAAVLAGGGHVQAQKVASIIREVNPDILLINEIDGNDSGRTVRAFVEGYLGGMYAYAVTPECNTGVQSGLDLNGNGKLNEPDDAYGFGWYDGQYCMAVLSKFPVDAAGITTFQRLHWANLEGAQVPLNEDGTPFYSPEAWAAMRLSSKNHVDVPVQVGGQVVHVLASHPTPPVFDGPEDRNGRRNFDEIGLWARYIDPAQTVPSDAGRPATLQAGDRFVIVGDLNASPDEGDAFTDAAGVSAIDQLLKHPLVHAGFGSGGEYVPTSIGGLENVASDEQPSEHAATHTAGWKMRADYVLPSRGFEVLGGGVFWPAGTDPHSAWVTAAGDGDVDSSDHRLVWVDLGL